LPARIVPWDRCCEFWDNDGVAVMSPVDLAKAAPRDPVTKPGRSIESHVTAKACSLLAQKWHARLTVSRVGHILAARVFSY
jgi:hypothetical protein